MIKFNYKQDKIIPFGNRILVQVDEQETKTSTGILITQSETDETLTGIVIRKGKGEKDKDGKDIPIDVQEQQRVIFRKNSGIKIGNFLLLQVYEVLAVLQEQ